MDVSKRELYLIALLYLPNARRAKKKIADPRYVPCAYQVSPRCAGQVKESWFGRCVCWECNVMLHQRANKRGTIRKWNAVCLHCQTPLEHCTVATKGKNKGMPVLELHHFFPVSQGRPITLNRAWNELQYLALDNPFYRLIVDTVIDKKLLNTLLARLGNESIGINSVYNKGLMCITCHDYWHGIGNEPNSSYKG